MVLIDLGGKASYCDDCGDVDDLQDKNCIARKEQPILLRCTMESNLDRNDLSLLLDPLTCKKHLHSFNVIKLMLAKDPMAQGTNHTIFDKYRDLLLENIDDIDNFMPYISTFQSRLWFTKMIEQVELYKMVMDRPGHVVELGVFHGESFFHWARLVEAFNMGERHTRVIGFDTFSGFPSISQKDQTTDTSDIDHGGKDLAVREGGFSSGERAYERIMKLIDIYEDDHFVPWRRRLEVVRGDIVKTVPEYAKKHPGMRINLLHLDCDLYEPTLCALETLYPRVVSGGMVILDEYAFEKFSGESSAFDEYFGDSKPVLTKSRIAHSPSGWWIKK